MTASDKLNKIIVAKSYEKIIRPIYTMMWIIQVKHPGSCFVKTTYFPHLYNRDMYATHHILWENILN